MSAILTAAGTIAGTALAGPAGGAAGGGIGGAIANLFGGPARDASRQQNVDWYKAAALQGSVIAARVIIAAPANVASNEDPMWIAAAGQVQSQRPDVWARANGQGGLWVNGTIQQVQAELQAIAQTSNYTQATTPLPPNPQVASTQPANLTQPQLLAGMTTTATAPGKISWLTIAILAAGAVVVVLLIVSGRKR